MEGRKMKYALMVRNDDLSKKIQILLFQLEEMELF